MIVVDTNVIAYFWIPGSYTQDAERVLQTDPEWKVPLLWKSELRNVLINYIRHELLTLDVALQMMSDAESHLKEHEFSVASSDVLKLSSQSKCTAYDCEFVALAEDLQVPLITTDKEVLSEFPSVALSMSDYIDTQKLRG
ncbi:MAG: type II toxin-antitoxin system VapC family toxin [bacterium]|nr:type II toxin-antitoxin system VapC family toxin [bacterium]